MSPRTSSILRLLVIPALAIGGVILVFNLEGGFFIRFGLILAAFVLVIDLATYCRGRWQNALVTCAALLFGLGAIEAVALTIMPRPIFAHSKGLFADHPDLGWAPSHPGAYPVERIQGGKSIYKAVYTIDPDLLRHVPSDPKGPTAAFFGDSFTFGDGVNDNETLPAHFAALAPHMHVLNLALSGYGPAQMLRAMQTGLFDKELKDARFFVIQTGPLHAERIACKTNFALRAPRYVMAGDKVEYKGLCTSGIGGAIRRFVADSAIERVFVSPLERKATHADIESYLAVMSAIAKLAKEKYGVPVVVIYLPAFDHLLDGTGFTDAEIESRLRADNMHVVVNDIDENLPVRIPGDGHYTSLGNRLIAKDLFDDLEKNKPNLLQGGS